MRSKTIGSIAVLLIVVLASCARQPQQTASEFDLDALAAERLAMSDLFSQQPDSSAAFDAEAARRQGFSAEAIQLAQEEVAYSNEVLNQLEATSEGAATLRITGDIEVGGSYPLFEAFTAAVAELEAAGGEVDVGTELTEQGLIPGLSEWYCGYIGRSRPSSAAPWRSYTFANPAAKLRSLGYHSTPGLVGGGWTRPRTYKSWLCGWKTYRDHAYILRTTTLREQNYAGYTPRGEPNPEIYRSGPWPYSTWPAYVYWWHSRH